MTCYISDVRVHQYLVRVAVSYYSNEYFASFLLSKKHIIIQKYDKLELLHEDYNYTVISAVIITFHWYKSNQILYCNSYIDKNKIFIQHIQQLSV